ncbi:hypothetical protein BCV72DRAFT_225173 [Rhizopus microsporus var. microsporus]|uniref:Uncharacterized protein n=1 Tax=Rhizopus microsporus var. microsporus TaxID=86635 RepID=A0A1X0R8S6_RHIZD|nr:hypothetical protein BCV72DRAFT_225173 [Rhizopus microsporus var. microsporus]
MSTNILPDVYKKYKLPVVNEGSSHFFSMYNAEEWSFEKYYQETHPNVNKSKQFQTIVKDYCNDLNWVAQLEGIPDTIREYARALIKEKKPTKAEMMANLAMNGVKKRKISKQNVTINGGTNIVGYNVKIENKEDSSDKTKVSKRKYNYVQETEDMDEENEKNKDDIANQIKTIQKPSVWLDWLKFLSNNKIAFHPFSPEANNIIRSGKGISSKPYLDKDLYARHLENHNHALHTIPEIFFKFIDAVVSCDDLRQFKSKAREVTLYIVSLDEKEEEAKDLEFLEEILLAAFKMYSSHINKYKYEDGFNQLFVWPYVDIIAKSITTSDCKSDFESGQPHLQSMTQQLRANNLYIDEKNCYKSDGLIKLYGIKQIELLLLETSGHFGSTCSVKLNFDHHKGMFGLLAMLKSIADEFHFAAIEKFCKVKVFLLHAAGKQLHLWSVCFQQEGIFDLWREADMTIKPDYDEKDEFIPALVKFCWMTKVIGILNK